VRQTISTSALWYIIPWKIVRMSHHPTPQIESLEWPRSPPLYRLGFEYPTACGKCFSQINTEWLCKQYRLQSVGISRCCALDEWLLDWSSDCSIAWLIHWSVVRWILDYRLAWLLGWLVDCQLEWLPKRWVRNEVIDSLFDWSRDGLVDCLILCWLMDWLLDSLIHRCSQLG